LRRASSIRILFHLPCIDRSRDFFVAIATKLNVIYQRAKPKDYLDIHAILACGSTH
jgi:hypothetical protein